MPFRPDWGACFLIANSISPFFWALKVPLIVILPSVKSTSHTTRESFAFFKWSRKNHIFKFSTFQSFTGISRNIRRRQSCQPLKPTSVRPHKIV